MAKTTEREEEREQSQDQEDQEEQEERDAQNEGDEDESKDEEESKDEDESKDEEESKDEDGEERQASPSISAKEMTQAALDTLRDLTGREPEAATGLQWDGESWLVTVDVLELERIPETTDLIATYVVQLDDDGGLRGYKRTRRFQRGQAEEE